MESGLEGVVAAETRLSEVDGAAGRLIIAGRRVEELAERARYEELWAALFGLAGIDAESESDPCTGRELDLSGLAERLGRARSEAFERLPALGDALEADDPMDGLRAATAHVRSAGDATTDALAVTGAMAVFAAAAARRRVGAAPLPPDSSAGHAADYLRMLRGDAPSAAEALAMDAYLCTVMDHGLNASTFAARVIVSTRSDLVGAVLGGLGALKGPLHGGAPGPVLDMLDAIAEPERAEAWLRAELAAGRRIMGMGHRVYRVRDPRAAVLDAALRRLGHDDRRRALALAVERAAERLLAERYPGRPLRANVEFFTAVLLEALGVPRALFTATFAVGRVGGWCAHAREQLASGRMLRPRARYVGRR